MTAVEATPIFANGSIFLKSPLPQDPQTPPFWYLFLLSKDFAFGKKKYLKRITLRYIALKILVTGTWVRKRSENDDHMLILIEKLEEKHHFIKYKGRRSLNNLLIYLLTIFIQKVQFSRAAYDNINKTRIN